MHGQEFTTPHVIAATVLTSLSCGFFHSAQGNWGTSQPDQLSTSTLWCPPTGWIKINLDRAEPKNNKAGIGIVVRNHRGVVQLTAGSGLSHWDPGQVEFAALLSLRRLLTPAMLEAKGIIIEGDCKNVLDVCRNSLRRANWNDATFIAHDLYFLAELNQLLIRHIPREANRLADFCATYGSSYNFVWNDVVDAPPEFIEIVHDDFG
ncbi:hypothetical protein KSP40_PGU004239 [Platanthera guangdongensis]|uniref:RNase H type-1 domain-containing protein n=1 Tax=Platanthera guangdongensis TaxID=2320717 RepID=A0ABR2LNE7_9ASPA